MRLSEETFTLGQPLFISQEASSLKVHDLGPDRATSTHEGVQAWFDLHSMLVTPRVVDSSPRYTVDGNASRVTHIACTDTGLTAVALIPTQAPAGLPISEMATVVMFPSLAEFLDLLVNDTTRAEGSQPVAPSTQSPPGHSQVHDIHAYRARAILDRSFSPTSFRALVSTRTGFVALTHDGEVHTWGDARYPHALGRGVSAGYPSNDPGCVEDLMGLNIVKVVTGGNLTGALTEGGDAFIWGIAKFGGGDAGTLWNAGPGRLRDVLADRGEGEHVVRVRLPILNDNGAVEDVGSDVGDEDPEILDIAVGDGHVLVIDVDHHVWACGSDEHGQLGLGEQLPNTADLGVDCKGSAKWHLIRTFEQLRKQKGKQAKKVYAGDLTSFVIVQEVDGHEEDIRSIAQSGSVQ